MYATDSNLDLAIALQVGRPVPTAREVVLSALRFAIHIQRVLEKVNIESGPGLRLIVHMEESAEAITATIEKAPSQRNPAKAGKYYAEVSQHVNKILHWLHQMENSGGIPQKDMQHIRECGSALLMSLTALCDESSSLPKRKRARLQEDLSDL